MRVLRYADAADPSRARGGRHNTREDPHSCTLARAIRTEESNNFTRIDRKVDFVDSGQGPVLAA